MLIGEKLPIGWLLEQYEGPKCSSFALIPGGSYKSVYTTKRQLRMKEFRMKGMRRDGADGLAIGGTSWTPSYV